MLEFGFEFFDKFSQRLLGPITLQNGELTTQSNPLGSYAQVVHVSWLGQGKQFQPAIHLDLKFVDLARL